VSTRPHFLQPLLQGPLAGWTLQVADRDRTLALTIEPAFDSTARKRGLLGRNALEPGTALVIAPSSGIHTFGMRFPIDVVFAGRDGRVVKIRPRIPRGRIAFAWGGFAVIEMAAGEMEKCGLKVGERLVAKKLEVPGDRNTRGPGGQER
jgi:uncharacterized membrane protein (UPF0127 family)